MLTDAIDMLDNAINEQETLTNGFSEWESEIQDIKKQQKKEVGKFVIKMKHLQTKSKNFETELDNIKSQINKPNKCQLYEGKLRQTINLVDKIIDFWRKFCEINQKMEQMQE